MSDNVPLEIQQEIIKWVPLKPLLQFRSVSKTWKSIIDSSKFINEYHIIHKHPHRLLLQYYGLKFISIIDDDTFPHKKDKIPFPGSIKLLRNPSRVVGCSNGLLCLQGYFPKVGFDTQRVVLWNPFLRKTIDVAIPCGSKKNSDHVNLFLNVVGFGVCPETNDVKLVMIDTSIPTHWVVKIFALSSRAWRSVSFDPPVKFKSFGLSWDQVSLNGFVYLLGCEDAGPDCGKTNLIVSFDLKSETLEQVHLPDILVHSHNLGLSKWNECLTVLEKSQTWTGVWMMKDGVTKSFTKMFTLKSCAPVSFMEVLGFRRNGDAIMITTNYVGENRRLVVRLQVCDPCSGDFNDITFGEINGPCSVSSYMETLLLLDQSDSISH